MSCSVCAAFAEFKVQYIHGPVIEAQMVHACSGKYAPIPACYSRELHALVGALLQKQPDARPCIADVLDLLLVRRHLRAYAAHIGLTCKPSADACDTAAMHAAVEVCPAIPRSKLTVAGPFQVIQRSAKPACLLVTASALV